MFNKKKTVVPAVESDVAANPDLIVHNMPSAARFSGASSNSQAPSSGGFAIAPAPKRNFQAIGLIIIAVGLVFISGVAYLSYAFIIKPMAGKDKEIVNKPAIPVIETVATSAAPVSPVLVATTSDVSGVPSAIVDLATSSIATTTEETADTNIIALPPLVDSDNDGLNDEEEMVLGTSATSSDTNANTYSDFTEINNNYNPLGSGRLITLAGLVKYTNPALGYELLYPKNWIIQSSNNDATIIFSAPDNSLIQIYTQDNPEKAGILSWYEDSFPETTPTYEKLISTDTWDGVIGEDGLNFYLTNKKHDNILVVSYVPAVTDRIVYPNIFKLMVNSLVLK